MITPTQEYRRTSHRLPKPLLQGLDAAVNNLMGRYQRRAAVLGDLREQAERIDELAKEYLALSSHQLQERLLEHRAQFRRADGEPDEENLRHALAAIREAADRQLGLRPFVVQLMGALALHRGCLAEMATGEGKTLTAGLAGVLAGWTKRPCHVITVNDYLVQRDAAWLKPLYTFCGVRVGHVTAALNQQERRHEYGCDVTYATSKEILADFLRDRIQLGPLLDPRRRLIRQMLAPTGPLAAGLVLRGLHTAIADEADSILIDEAVTPLIISTMQKNEALREVVLLARDLTADLQAGVDYQVNARYKEIELTPAALEKVATRCAALPGIWRGHDRRLEVIRQAFIAREFYHRGKQYIVEEDKVVIVDEFTGRPMPQRTWREGIHQAIEAKEGLPISDPTETTARMSFQRFFRLYEKLAGMTGTAHEAAGELWQVYHLPVITIPTNRPCIRHHLPDRVFAAESDKWEAIANEVVNLHATGRPVLVGTRSVAMSEKLAALLAARQLEFKLLNAVHLKEEAQIVSMAGDRGRVTIATNMAGRGTDIKLGHGVVALGGLHVLATERHESGRVDRQLFGRAARQGDPGSAQAWVSAEDELLRRYLPAGLQPTLVKVLQRSQAMGERMAGAAFALAQQKAQGMAFRQRRGVLRTDTWLEDALSFAGPESA